MADINEEKKDGNDGTDANMSIFDMNSEQVANKFKSGLYSFFSYSK